MYLKASKFSIPMNFLMGELKHPCRHDAQNDSDVRKITHTFSIKKLISQQPFIRFVFLFCFLFFVVVFFLFFVFAFVFVFVFLFFLLSLIERYLSPLFNEAIFRIKKKRFILAFFA